MDIEHNVIVPNMYFKYIFNQLKKKINELGELKAELKQLDVPSEAKEEFEAHLGHFDTVQNEMMIYHRDLVKHHANISLFLESLFRREHFRKGHLVLHTRKCFIEREIMNWQTLG